MSLPLQPDLRHENQAEHNSILLQETCFHDPCGAKNLDFKDWNITIVFYTALHYVQSYLHKKGYQTTFSNHTERNNYLANLSKMDHPIAKIVSDYVALFKVSLYTRYNPCYYHYIKQKDVCDYTKFALETLPKELGVA
jgi:hypothetical protein